MALEGKLRVPERYITTHDAKTGKAIFEGSIPSKSPFYATPSAPFATMYATDKFPVEISDSADLQTYREFLAQPPGISNSTGTILRYVDMAPGALSPMHRTVSLDYGVVVEGEVELVLDSDEVRVMKRGDVSVQRGTMHAWRNTSKTEWARMLYILQPSKPIELDGKLLGEDYGGMQGVRSSS